MEDRDQVVEEVRENFVLKKLQERVWRLECDNKGLKVNNELLNTQYTSQRETQSDILRNLHSNIDDNYQKIEEQDKAIDRLNQQLQAQKQEFEDRLEEEKAQWENKVQGLQKQKEHLEERLHDVRDCRNDKEYMESELQRLTNELQHQADAHIRVVSEFDRDKAIKVDELKKDMHRKVKETREMLRARTKDQLDQTTKRAIMENEQMVTQLHYQNKESERLLNSNSKLLEENAQLRRNLAIHKDIEGELAKRTHDYQRKLKRMDNLHKAELASRDQAREPEGSVGEEASRLFEASRELSSSMYSPEECDRIKKQLDAAQTNLAMARHEFASYRKEHATLTQLQDPSTRLIVSVLYELKNQRESADFPPATYDESADWQFADTTAKQKEYFFRMLLEKLNSSMCGSCFPTGAAVPSAAQGSTTSLPSIHRPAQQATEEASHGHFSQFLWSVATNGVQPCSGPQGGACEMVTRSVQTETSQSDPCLKEGLWNPSSRKGFTGDANMVTPAMVTGGVRAWGPRSVSHRRR